MIRTLYSTSVFVNGETPVTIQGDCVRIGDLSDHLVIHTIEENALEALREFATRLLAVVIVAQVERGAVVAATVGEAEVEITVEDLEPEVVPF